MTINLKSKKELEGIRARFATYSIEELLQTGRELAKGDDYLEAFFAFNELFQREHNTKLKDLSRLYAYATASLMYKEIREGINLFFEGEIATETEKRVVDSLKENMVHTINSHIDGKLLSEDLFTLEKIVDLFPFDEIELTKEKRFQKIYNKFKEYALKVYVENQRDKKCINL